MRMSQLFSKTLREAPAGADSKGYEYLLRAGFIRQLGAGIFSLLPLGYSSVKKIEQIIREEMDAIGGQEILMPVVNPADIWKETGRFYSIDREMSRFKDRVGRDMVLAMTHEEAVTDIARFEIDSYKRMPRLVYQIQTKWRDDPRPRAGLIRVREFTMKDSYSFDMDQAGLEASYQAHRGAYIKIFDRLGFEYVIVNAHSGAMGGSASEEFLAIAPNGEDTFVRSPGGFAANVEAVQRQLAPEQDASDVPAAKVHDTPDSPTIDTLVAQANALFPRADRPWQAHDTLKNVVFKLTHPDGRTEALAVGLPGDREVDLKRLESAISPAVAEPFTEEDFEARPKLVKGYIGPLALGYGQLADGQTPPPDAVRYLVDPAVVPGTRWLTGADEFGKHVADLVVGRDFTPDGYLDVAEIREGDLAPDGSGPLSLARGIEMGHIFQLGTKYAEALGLKVLDANGKLQTVTMGSYGIGVSRAVAAVAESTCDDKGLCWPRAVAPYDVEVLSAGKGNEIAETVERIAAELAERGVSVLLDDRKASPGVKFADAELLGMPTSVVVGRLLADGKVEIRDRKSGSARQVPVDAAVGEVLAEIGR